MSAAPPDTPSHAGRVKLAARIVLAFLGVGPPIGGLTLLLLSLVDEAFGRVEFGLLPSQELGSAPGEFLTHLLVASYWFGAVPIGGAGLAIGIKQAFFGPAPWWMAFGAGVVAGVVIAGIFSVLLFSGSVSGVVQLALFLSYVVPIMLCWRMVRSWQFGSASY
jgi:hypothetical protein